ncbi:MAG: hypothetical protein RL769_75 [Pseudomonadota bacterium]|jgi:hypothetical protein
MPNINNQGQTNSSEQSGISLIPTSFTIKDQVSSRELPAGVTRTEIDPNFEEKISINQKHFNFFKEQFNNIKKKQKKILFLSLLGSSTCIAGFGSLVSGYLAIGGGLLGAGFLLVISATYLNNTRERNLRLSLKEKSEIQEGEIGLVNNEGNFQAVNNEESLQTVNNKESLQTVNNKESLRSINIVQRPRGPIEPESLNRLSSGLHQKSSLSSEI